MHTSIRPVHRLSRKATRLSRVGTSCQWFVTKIAAAITAAPATMAIGIPMIGKYAPNPLNREAWSRVAAIKLTHCRRAT